MLAAVQPVFEFLEKRGVYAILNTVDGKYYIGSAINFKRRFARHIRLLNSNLHPNKHLQSAWNKYGSDAFSFQILEYCEKEKLVKHEQSWIDFTNCTDRSRGYNICKIADNRTGVLHTEETKAKMSTSHKGVIKSKEWQDKITKAITGKKREPSVGKAHSERMKGFKHSDETRERMRFSQTGRKHSEESKRKRSEKLKGRLIRPTVMSI